jgi:hypothetical protein
MAVTEKIFARSPRIVTINEPGQTSTKIEVWIWNGSIVDKPTLPTHKASKPIPSPTNTETHYNISPYIREYLAHNELQSLYCSYADTNPNSQWCWVSIKSWYLIGEEQTEFSEERTYKAFDGYGYYEEGLNPDRANTLLNIGFNYHYYMNPFVDPCDPLFTPGHITVSLNQFATYTVIYTGLVSGISISVLYAVSDSSEMVMDVTRVHDLHYQEGNSVIIYDETFTGIWKGIFRPMEECRYEPIAVDFVNYWGAWSRVFFFKASNDSIETNGVTYNLLQSKMDYDIMEGQRKEFNVNGLKSIKVNSGFVQEDFKDIMQELLLSERILVNLQPATLKTKSIEKYKDINTKLINYTLDFEYAFDIINSVV